LFNIIQGSCVKHKTQKTLLCLLKGGLFFRGDLNGQESLPLINLNYKTAIISKQMNLKSLVWGYIYISIVLSTYI